VSDGRPRGTVKSAGDVLVFIDARAGGKTVSRSAAEAGVTLSLGKKWSRKIKALGPDAAVKALTGYTRDEIVAGRALPAPSTEDPVSDPRRRGAAKLKRSQQAKRRAQRHEPVEPEVLAPGLSSKNERRKAPPPALFVTGPSDEGCGGCEPEACAGHCRAGQWDRFVEAVAYHRRSSAPDLAVLEAATGGTVAPGDVEMWARHGRAACLVEDHDAPEARFYRAWAEARAAANAEINEAEKAAVARRDKRGIEAMRLARENLASGRLNFGQADTSQPVGAQVFAAIWGE